MHECTNSLCKKEFGPNVPNIDTCLLASSKHLTILYIQTGILRANYCKPKCRDMFMITLNPKLFRLAEA